MASASGGSAEVAEELGIFVASAFRRKRGKPVCLMGRMTHPYPPHRANLPYTGKHHYFLTFCTDRRRCVFVEQEHVTLVSTQILRAAHETGFEIAAYCFMPDHVHMIVAGKFESSDAKRFIKLAKQYSGYCFKRETGVQLWQRYGFERIIRDDAELAFTGICRPESSASWTCEPRGGVPAHRI